MDFETIEKKIIATLRSDVSALRTVEGYAGQLEGEIETLPVRFPAAFVVYGGSEYEPLDGPGFREVVDFTVLLCSRNPRRSGSPMYDLATEVRTALANRTLGLEIERLTPVRVSLLAAEGQTAIYALEFRSGFDTTYEYRDY